MKNFLPTRYIAKRSIVVSLVLAVAFVSGCSGIPTESQKNIPITLIAKNGGAWFRQLNQDLQSVLEKSTEEHQEFINFTPSAPLGNIQFLAKHQLAAVFQASPNTVEAASEGRLKIVVPPGNSQQQTVVITEDGSRSTTTRGNVDSSGIRSEPIPKVDGITALFPVPPMITYLVVSDLSGLKRLEDLRGKDIAWLTFDDKSSRMQIEKYLRANNIAADTMLTTEESFSDAVDSLRRERIDGFFVRRLGATDDLIQALLSLDAVGIKVISLSAEQVNALGRTPIDLPPDTVPAQTNKITTASSLTFAYANSKVSDAAAYQLVKAFWENQPALVAKSSSWKSVTPTLLDEVRVPFHPGALRYYKEIGITLP